MPSQIVWFRNDLRLADQAAVRAAAAAGPVVAVFVLDDDTPGDWRVGAAQRWWLHYSLAALDADLRRMGGRLLLRRGLPGDVLPQLAAATGASAVHALHHYEPWAQYQEAAVAAALELHLHDGAYLAPPGTVTQGDGKRYRIFTPFWNALQRRMPPGETQPAPMIRFADAPAGDDLADWGLLPTDPDWSRGFDVWTPGEAGAHAALAAFTDIVDRYDEGRNIPGEVLTSRLSPHLHHGEISPAQVWAAVAGAGDAALPFLREIGWRDFAAETGDQFPAFADAPNRPAFARFPYRNDPEALRAWQRGQTGYPIVDAGMRQLWTTGWMHNRVRMIAASFLTKHLLLDWRSGERWFWDCLVDADFGNNSLGWQWIMGSGADSSPFTRIFAPVGQSEKFDAQGKYIRQWVPELAKLRDDAIHAPWDAAPLTLAGAGVRLGETYPHPIVNHAAARARALAAYDTIRA
jgi:deoxyribodipyrimidine photo-lyase